MKTSPKALKDQLGLQPLTAEGGFYKRSYESNRLITIDKDGDPQKRHLATAIYYLLEADEKSVFHHLSSDEMWHFYLGDPLTIAEITPDGDCSQTILSNQLEQHQLPQHLVPAGNHFGAYIQDAHKQHGFSLVGCTVFPGFDFADFEVSSKEQLLELAPGEKALIERLC